MTDMTDDVGGVGQESGAFIELLSIILFIILVVCAVVG